MSSLQNVYAQAAQDLHGLPEAGKGIRGRVLRCDNSETEFQEYFSAMPWKAIPFESAKREELMQKFDVQGIPTLLLMDEASGVYKMNGREAITNANDFPWKN